MAALTSERAQVGEDIAAQKAQRDILAAFFKAHPMTVFLREDLERVVGPNYRSRVSECVTELGMNVPNVPRYRHYLNAKGKPRRQRLIGGYQYLPYETLGRDASIPAPDRWPVFDAPIQETWSLKP